MSRKLLIALVALVAVLTLGVGCLAAYIFFIQPAQGGEYTPRRMTARVEAADFYSMNEFVTNLADTNRTRYIKFSISLGMARAGAEADLEKYEPLMRDAIVSQARSMTAEELSGAQGKDRLAEVIEEGLRTIPAVDMLLVKVYVTDMVIQ